MVPRAHDPVPSLSFLADTPFVFSFTFIIKKREKRGGGEAHASHVYISLVTVIGSRSKETHDDFMRRFGLIL